MTPARLSALTLCFVLASVVSAQTRHPSATHHVAAKEAPADIIHNVFWQPNELHQGSPAFFTVELAAKATKVSGRFAGKPLAFFRDAHDPKLWHALGGAVLDTRPGEYALDIHATLATGRAANTSQQINVAAGDFKTGDITVPDNMVNPTDAEQKQIAGDQVLKDHAYARSSPKILWSGNFLKPVDAPSTPSFGESRILNEEKSSLHTGTDFPVKEGTPIHAANSGTVVLVRDLFYEGNCIIVDHGQHLFTVYMHLSRTDVKEGDKVEKGKVLGLSGASGRVTGPHLHMAVRWEGGWLDPVAMLALTLPKTGIAEPSATHHPVAHKR